jgi:predicted enzyme related to lactoylglutathione lyase
MPANAVHWFEIPATDLQRAVRFYNQVLGLDMSPFEMFNCQMAMFPAEGGVGGAVIQQAGCLPGASGTVVYLDCGPDLSIPLEKVAAAGGTVVMPKTSIGEHGFCAQFLDTEGNRVGLHSVN